MKIAKYVQTHARSTRRYHLLQHFNKSLSRTFAGIYSGYSYFENAFFGAATIAMSDSTASLAKTRSPAGVQETLLLQ